MLTERFSRRTLLATSIVGRASLGLALSVPKVMRAVAPGLTEIDLSQLPADEAITNNRPWQYRFSGRLVCRSPQGAVVLIQSDDVDLDSRWSSVLNTYGSETVARAVRR